MAKHHLTSSVRALRHLLSRPEGLVALTEYLALRELTCLVTAHIITLVILGGLPVMLACEANFI
jgi:hypothetical protein